jgi:1-acyl-sn-glycerol-3-phosphate acyltransferase
MRFSVSVVIFGKIVVQTLRICAPTVVESALGRRGEMDVYDRRIDEWSTKLLKDADVRIELAGEEHLDTDEAFVIMSNHQSHYDVVVLFQVLRRRVRMVAKKELFRVPFFAGAMRAAGFIEIDRSDREKAIAALEAAEEALKLGTSIWIAPEGTRSETGELGPFKKGGFHLALDTGARILPVTLVGTRDVLRPHDWRVQKGKRVLVHVGEPIDPKRYGKDRRDELMQVVRDAIEKPLSAPRP